MSEETNVVYIVDYIIRRRTQDSTGFPPRIKRRDEMPRGRKREEMRKHNEDIIRIYGLRKPKYTPPEKL